MVIRPASSSALIFGASHSTVSVTGSFMARHHRLVVDRSMPAGVSSLMAFARFATARATDGPAINAPSQSVRVSMARPNHHPACGPRTELGAPYRSSSPPPRSICSATP